jgi:hypothetical protein
MAATNKTSTASQTTDLMDMPASYARYAPCADQITNLFLNSPSASIIAS